MLFAADKWTPHFRLYCVRVINACRVRRDVRVAPCWTDTRNTSRHVTSQLFQMPKYIG